MTDSASRDTYSVEVTVTQSTVLQIRAESEEEAREKAENREYGLVNDPHFTKVIVENTEKYSTDMNRGGRDD